MKGSRVILMMEPGSELICSALALFRMGAVPIVLDATTDLRELQVCLKSLNPEVFIGTASANLRRLMARWSLPSIHSFITMRAPWFWLGMTFEDLQAGGDPAGMEMVGVSASDPALICISAGRGSGPRAIEHTNGSISACMDALRTSLGTEGLHLASSPLMAVLSSLTGLGSLCPQMDTRRPALADPTLLAELIEDHAPAIISGSPALLGPLLHAASQSGRKLSTVRRLWIHGAPVSLEMLEELEACLAEDVEIFMGYGTAECPVISMLSSAELRSLANKAESDRGICLGRPVDDLELEVSEKGEIQIRGESVSPAALSESEWHQTGDLGFMDDQGRLWFLGPESGRVQTRNSSLDPVPIELIFNAHEQVALSALVGTGQGEDRRAVLVVQTLMELTPEEQARLGTELQAHAETLGLQLRTILFHENIPVDLMHRAHIQRVELESWVDTQT
jgi:acyl-coenzyme A synthetase/AMP-(fatty) acid ligase